MAKAVEGLPDRGGVAKAVYAWPRPWRRGQGREGGDKAVGAWQGLGGEAKAVAKVLGAWPRPWGLV